MPATLQHFTKINISGKVTQTFPYCGGARPTAELVKSLATPVAYPNKKFYIREGRINSTAAKIVTSFTTDSSGVFNILLAPGIYAVLIEEQLDEIKADKYASQYQQVDNKCLQEWWVKPYYLLEVKGSDITGLDFNFMHRCFLATDVPCITYTGPMPH